MKQSKPFFQDNGSSHIRLNRRQLKTRDLIREKIDSGEYDLEDYPCICGSRDDILISETDRYGLSLKFVICSKCGLLRMNPRLNKESFIRFYHDDYRDLFMEFESIPVEYFKRLEYAGESIISLIREHCKTFTFKDAKVLDLGCSCGGTLVPFMREGSIVKGYDYDRRYIDFGKCHKKDLDIEHGGIDSISDRHEEYDLIICDQLLEHLVDPAGSLKIITEALKPEGLLYVAVPDLKNHAHYASPTKSFLGALHISHTFYFTRNTLMNLMGGMEVVYIDDEISSIFRKTSAAVSFRSDYPGNLIYINSYEKSLLWKLKRLFMAAGNFLFHSGSGRF